MGCGESNTIAINQESAAKGNEVKNSGRGSPIKPVTQSIKNADSKDNNLSKGAVAKNSNVVTATSVAKDAGKGLKDSKSSKNVAAASVAKETAKELKDSKSSKNLSVSKGNEHRNTGDEKNELRSTSELKNGTKSNIKQEKSNISKSTGQSMRDSTKNLGVSPSKIKVGIQEIVSQNQEDEDHQQKKTKKSKKRKGDSKLGELIRIYGL